MSTFKEPSLIELHENVEAINAPLAAAIENTRQTTPLNSGEKGYTHLHITEFIAEEEYGEREFSPKIFTIGNQEVEVTPCSCGVYRCVDATFKILD